MTRREAILREIGRRVETVAGVAAVEIGRFVDYGQDDPATIAFIFPGDDDPISQAQSLTRQFEAVVGITHVIAVDKRNSKDEWFAFEELLALVVRAIEVDPAGSNQRQHQEYRRLQSSGVATPGLLTHPIVRGNIEPWDIDGGETSLAAAVTYECRYQVPFGEL